MTQPANPVRERLAAYAHEAWSGWMGYMLGKCTEGPDGTVVIPSWAAERWTRQLSTPYADLPESEQASDLDEADKMLAIMGQMPRGDIFEATYDPSEEEAPPSQDRMNEFGRSSVCICKKADPAWLAEDERLRQEFRRLKAEYRRQYDERVAAGWQPNVHPWPADIGDLERSVYGPDGISTQIDIHRYGVPPGARLQPAVTCDYRFHGTPGGCPLCGILPAAVAKIDHASCREMQFSIAGKPGVIHDCPPCPHGLERGAEFSAPTMELLTMQRQLKLQAVDQLRCEDHHPQLVGQMPRPEALDADVESSAPSGPSYSGNPAT